MYPKDQARVEDEKPQSRYPWETPQTPNVMERKTPKLELWSCAED